MCLPWVVGEAKLSSCWAVEEGAIVSVQLVLGLQHSCRQLMTRTEGAGAEVGLALAQVLQPWLAAIWLPFLAPFLSAAASLVPVSAAPLFAFPTLVLVLFVALVLGLVRGRVSLVVRELAPFGVSLVLLRRVAAWPVVLCPSPAVIVAVVAVEVLPLFVVSTNLPLFSHSPFLTLAVFGRVRYWRE